jgi:hypothetical protein
MAAYVPLSPHSSPEALADGTTTAPARASTTAVIVAIRSTIGSLM